MKAARAALDGRNLPDLDLQLTEAENALHQAERELATQADATADEILAALKQEAERRAREHQNLIVQLQSAEASYYQAADYIAARRRFIDYAARTRLAEAERHLETAKSLAANDPRAALVEAIRAQELAEDAYALAREDFEANTPYAGWGTFPRRPAIPIPFPFPVGGGG